MTCYECNCKVCQHINCSAILPPNTGNVILPTGIRRDSSVNKESIFITGLIYVFLPIILPIIILLWLVSCGAKYIRNYYLLCLYTDLSQKDVIKFSFHSDKILRIKKDQNNSIPFSTKFKYDLLMLMNEYPFTWTRYCERHETIVISQQFYV